MRPLRMTALIAGKRYATDTSTLLAQGQHEGGPDWAPQAVKFTFLFRTSDGRFFAQHRMGPDGGNVHNERYWVEPLSELDAIPLFWELEQHELEFEAAFATQDRNAEWRR